MEMTFQEDEISYYNGPSDVSIESEKKQSWTISLFAVIHHHNLMITRPHW